MKFFIIALLFSASLLVAGKIEKNITPSEVFSKINYLHEDIIILKKYFGIKKSPEYLDIKTKLLPRHAWQRTYELFVKVNILREKYDLPLIEPINMEPTLDLAPVFTYEQILRLIQEVEIFKLHFGIIQKPKKTKTFANKTPTDVYNELNKISRELDLINGKEFTPSYVFSETIRINEDIESILSKLNVNDLSTPPLKKVNGTPKDSFIIALELLNSIKKIELNAGLKTVDFYAFKRKKINPADVFEITQIILAELQVIKAYIGLTYNVTKGAKRYDNKTPGDVAQMMGWLLKKSHQIQLFSNRM